MSWHGLFQFISMLFGLENAPDKFYPAMDVILSTFTCQLTLDYLDKIVIFSKNLETHIKQGSHGVTQIYDARVTNILKKSEFFSNAANALVLLIYTGKLAVLKHTIDLTCNLKPLQVRQRQDISCAFTASFNALCSARRELKRN